jgi:hypothetical protein
MFISKNSGDELAKIFQDLLNKKLEKKAMNHEDQEHCNEDHVHDASCMTDDASDSLENDMKDMIIDQDNKAEDAAYDCAKDEDDAKDHDEVTEFGEFGFGDFAMDKESVELMKGLGKIAGSLRRKGEDFAADVVEATALSISGDLRKEAALKSKVSSEKEEILNELEKMASRLSEKGNKKAAVEVIKTASKIAKS